jgi:hypothetical protein
MGAGQYSIFSHSQPPSSTAVQSQLACLSITLARSSTLLVKSHFPSPTSTHQTHLGGCSDHGLYSSAGTSLASERLVRNLVIHWDDDEEYFIRVAARSSPLLLSHFYLCSVFAVFEDLDGCVDARYLILTLRNLAFLSDASPLSPNTSRYTLFLKLSLGRVLPDLT